MLVLVGVVVHCCAAIVVPVSVAGVEPTMLDPTVAPAESTWLMANLPPVLALMLLSKHHMLKVMVPEIVTAFSGLVIHAIDEPPAVSVTMIAVAPADVLVTDDVSPAPLTSSA